MVRRAKGSAGGVAALVAAAGIVCLVGVGLATSGAIAGAPPSQETLDRFLGPGEVPEQWASDLEAFPKELPPGIGWPSSVPSFLTAKGTMSEKGLPAITLAFYWACAWENHYLEGISSDNSGAQELALTQLGEFSSIPAVRVSFPDEPVWYKTVVEPALQGDPGPIRSDFEQSCQVYTESAGE